MRDSGFADTGLADEYDDLALALFGRRPAVHQQSQLGIALDDPDLTVLCRETLVRRIPAGNGIHGPRSGNSLEAPLAERLQEVSTPEQPPGALRYYDLVVRGEGLE